MLSWNIAPEGTSQAKYRLDFCRSNWSRILITGHYINAPCWSVLQVYSQEYWSRGSIMLPVPTTEAFNSSWCHCNVVLHNGYYMTAWLAANEQYCLGYPSLVTLAKAVTQPKVGRALLYIWFSRSKMNRIINTSPSIQKTKHEGYTWVFTAVIMAHQQSSCRNQGLCRQVRKSCNSCSMGP